MPCLLVILHGICNSAFHLGSVPLVLVIGGAFEQTLDVLYRGMLLSSTAQPQAGPLITLLPVLSAA